MAEIHSRTSKIEIAGAISHLRITIGMPYARTGWRETINVK